MPAHEDSRAQLLKSGIWNVHMRDARSESARVRGLRYYFEGVGSRPLADAGEGRSQIPGSDGYVALVPQSIRSVDDATQSLQVDLTHARDFLVSKRAWDSNVRGLSSCSQRAVPVVWVREMRPARMCLGASDVLLGHFRCVAQDMASLACTLTSDDQNEWERARDLLRHRVSVDLPGKEVSGRDTAGNEPCRKRRRLEDASSTELQQTVYTPRGALMGPRARENFTGHHCKDAWVAAIQRASATISIQAFCISEPEILSELAAAARRGITIRIRVDARQQDSGALAPLLEEHGGAAVAVHPVVVSEDDERCLMHKKELIVDGLTEREDSSCLVTGSYNPTYRARFNQESALCVMDFASVSSFAQRFDHDWSADRVAERCTKDVGRRPPQ